MLEADIQLRLRRLNLDAAFMVAAGEVLALLGPNGSGKSTTLKALVGLLPLAGGRVVLDGTVLEDPQRRIRVAPEKRPIALMFQDYLLFPHLSALENVAFGLRCRGTDKKVARQQAAEALTRLGLDEVVEARPGAMSGGQQQRVAMARALVTDPRLLLLDEPLAALDVSIKTNVRRLLRDVLRKSNAANVLVTHDLLDAVALGDRMIVLENGGVVQTGTPAEVTARPRSRYVADLTGVNLLRGTAHGTLLELDGGGQLSCAAPAAGPALAVIAPATVSVARERPEGQEENTWSGQISAVDLMGDRVRVHVDGTPAITAEVQPAAVDQLKLDDGGKIWAWVSSSDISVYPP
ncbi:MAG TPA: ABC transporter ATP-binding protein [Trebonia sp.]|nr:ABC transporter ATP-binding protein [Trebonia sp.]